MNVKKAYAQWSEIYDTNTNRTRDMEAMVLRSVLSNLKINHCLELGCGTGKNTEWLVNHAASVLAVDFSTEMLAIAQQKVQAANVVFLQADLNLPWNFTPKRFDLAVFSLVLEHISNLDFIFENLEQKINPGGLVYIAELHPFKQYTGTKARFGEGEQITEVECFVHHVSDFTESAKKCNFEVVEINEYFDQNDRKHIPRLLQLMFRKK